MEEPKPCPECIRVGDVVRMEDERGWWRILRLNGQFAMCELTTVGRRRMVRVDTMTLVRRGDSH